MFMPIRLPSLSFAPTPWKVCPIQITIEPLGITAWVVRSSARGPVELPQRCDLWPQPPLSLSD